MIARFFAVAGLAAAVFVNVPNAQARSLDDILSVGSIRIGVNPNYPPNAMYDDQNQLAGFDIDMGNRLAEMLGVKAEYVVVDPASRVPFVTSDKIDIVMGGMSRTPDRAKLIDFSLPVNTEGSAVLTTEGSTYENVADMNTDKVTFAEVRGTTPAKFIQDKLPNAKLLALENWNDALRTVADGRATALVADPAFYSTLLSNFPDTKWKILKGAAGPVAYDCLGLQRGNTTLLRWVNIALFSMQKDGFIDNAWKKWHHADMFPKIEPQPYF